MTTEDTNTRTRPPAEGSGRRTTAERFAPFPRGSLLLLAAFGVLIGAFSAWGNSAGRLPFYATQRFDPEICYLLNSVAPFVGAPYTYVDHPGTPVQIFGTVALAPFRLAARDSESFCLAVLQNPDRYLSVLHLLTALGVAVGAFLLARHMVLRWRVPPFAAVAAAVVPYAFHPLAFPALNLWSHNSLAYPLLPLALLFCADNLSQADGPTGWRTLVSGLLFGMLAAMQFYHVVWVAAALLGTAGLLWRGVGFRSVVRSACLLSAGAGIGFLVSTLPVAKNYAGFFGFIWRIASRTGHYGNGAAGVPTGAEWLANLHNLAAALGAFPWALGLAVTAASLLLLFRSAARGAALWVLAGIAVLAVAIVKHPQPIYTLALNAALPALVLFCICSASERAYRRLVRPALVLVVVAVGVNLGFSIQREAAQLAAFRDSVGKVHGTIDTMIQQGGRAREDTLILYTYLVPQRANALRFGDSYSGGIFTGRIDRAYPSDGFLNLGETEIRLPDGWPRQLDTAAAYVAVCERFRSMLPALKNLTPCAQIKWGETLMASGDVLLFEIRDPLFNLPKPAGSMAAIVAIDQSIASIVAVDPRSSAPWWGLEELGGWIGATPDESFSLTLWARQEVTATLSLEAQAGPGEAGIELLATLNKETVAARTVDGTAYSHTSFALPLQPGRNELRLSSSRRGRVEEPVGERRRALGVRVRNLWLENAAAP
jgi:hypothetical protein